MLNTIFLIVGRSGSGKTTLCEQLHTISKLNPIESYTTRKPRYDGERGHIFVNSFHEWVDEHPDESIVAYTFFDDSHYWATTSQVNSGDLYVIDPKGVEYLRERYTGTKKIKVVYVDATLRERFKRMVRRGDSIVSALRRIWHDKREFRGWKEKADFVVENHDLTESFTILNNYINQFRHQNKNECEKYNTKECLNCEDAEVDDGAVYCMRGRKQ